MQTKWMTCSAILLVAGVLLGSEVGAQEERLCVLGGPSSLEMNTVTVGNLVKTIKVEKVILQCATGTATPDSIVDLQLFTEVIERLHSASFEVVGKRFEVITCEKPIGGVTLPRCQLSTPQTLSEAPTILNCTVSEAQPLDPIAMNTIVHGDFVKTIKAQKELFACQPLPIPNPPPVPLAVDLNTFTEIIQRKQNNKFVVVDKRVEATVCLIENDGTVSACGAFPILPPPPAPEG